MSFLGQPARNVAIDRHPHVELVVESLDPPPEMSAPQFVLTRYIAQRLKRDRSFDGPTVGCKQTLRFHHDVGIEIFALPISPNAVGLNSQRIEIKFIGLTSIIESVEENADVIIIENIVAFSDRGPDFVRLVVTMKGDIDKL